MLFSLLVGYILFVILITCLIDCNRESLSDKYWYYLRIHFAILIIPDVIVWYLYSFEGINLSFRVSLLSAIKIAPFIAALISTWVSDS